MHIGAIYLIFFFVLFICPKAEGAHKVVIQPFIEIQNELSDNVFLANEARQYDLITIASPGFEAILKSRTMDISFLYKFGYSNYSRFPDNNSWRHNADLSGNINFSRHSRLQFGNAFLVTEEPTEEIDERSFFDEEEIQRQRKRIAETEVARRTRERHLTNVSNIRFIHHLNAYSSLSMDWEYRIQNSEDPSVRNRRGLAPSIDMNYWIIPKTLELIANIGYSRDEALDSSDELGFIEESMTPSIAINYWPIPKQLEFSAAFAYERGVVTDKEAFASSQEAPDNWYESVRPTFNVHFISPRAHLTVNANVSYNKGLTYSEDHLSNPTDDFESWSSGIEIAKQLNRRWKIIAGFTYSQTDFLESDETSLTGEDYNVFSPSIGIDYIMAEDLPFSISIGRITRDRAFWGSESNITINSQIGPWQFIRNGSITFQADSGYEESLLGAERLGFGTYYNMNFLFHYVFSPDVEGEIYGSYKRNDYKDYQETRDDREIEMGTRLNYQIFKWLALQLNYRYCNVDSTEEKDSYRENRFILNLVMSPYKPMEVH